MDKLMYYSLDTTEFKHTPIKTEDNFFIDTRLNLQEKVRGKKGEVLRKQQLQNPLVIRTTFPLKENVVYTNDVSGINTKLLRKVQAKSTAVPW